MKSGASVAIVEYILLDCNVRRENRNFLVAYRFSVLPNSNFR